MHIKDEKKPCQWKKAEEGTGQGAGSQDSKERETHTRNRDEMTKKGRKKPPNIRS